MMMKNFVLPKEVTSNFFNLRKKKKQFYFHEFFSIIAKILGMCIFPRSSNNSSSATSSGKKLMRSRSEITRTPSSGMRHNPFDSQISVDRLGKMPFQKIIIIIIMSAS